MKPIAGFARPMGKYVISVSWFLASGWESGVGGSASYDQLEAEPPTQHDKAEPYHEGQPLETQANHIRGQAKPAIGGRTSSPQMSLYGHQFES